MTGEYPDFASSIGNLKNETDSRGVMREKLRRATGCVKVRLGVFCIPPTNDLIHYGKGLTDIESYMQEGETAQSIPLWSS